MSEYKLKIMKENDVDRIQIKFDGGEEFSLPVDDILAAIEQHKQQPVQPKKRVMKRAVMDDSAFVRTRFKGDMGEEYPHD